MIEIFIILLGLMATAFFAGTETAFVARLYNTGKGICEWWRQRPERILSTTLVGTNIAIVLASSVATERAIEIWGGIGEVYVTISLSITALIFCEIIPKSAALRWSNRWTQIAAYPLLVFHWALIPIIAASTAFSRIITGIVEKSGTPAMPEPVEMMEVLRKPMRGLDEGRLLALMLFLRFAGRRAMDIMLPLGKLVTVPVGTKAGEVHRILAAGAPYVVIGDGDNPIGLLDANLAGMLSPNEIIGMKNISKMFIPEIKGASEFLCDISAEGFIPALVVDEFGTVTGAIGGEPMIARIIRTRTTSPTKALKFPNTSIVVRADTPIEKVEMITGIAMPKGPYQTIAGFIEECLHNIPEAKTTVTWESLRFRIISANKRGIHMVEITRTE